MWLPLQPAAPISSAAHRPLFSLQKLKTRKGAHRSSRSPTPRGRHVSRVSASPSSPWSAPPCKQVRTCHSALAPRWRGGHAQGTQGTHGPDRPACRPAGSRRPESSSVTPRCRSGWICHDCQATSCGLSWDRGGEVRWKSSSLGDRFWICMPRSPLSGLTPSGQRPAQRHCC